MPGIISAAMNNGAISVKGDGGKMVSLTPDQLDTMDHAQIYRLRDYNADNPEIDKKLAPYEHQAFSREWTKEMPFIAVPSLAIATPIYAAAKSLGIDVPIRSVATALGLINQDGDQRTATPPAMDQIRQGYRGIMQGLGIAD